MEFFFPQGNLEGNKIALRNTPLENSGTSGGGKLSDLQRPLAVAKRTSHPSTHRQVNYYMFPFVFSCLFVDLGFCPGDFLFFFYTPEGPGWWWCFYLGKSGNDASKGSWLYMSPADDDDDDDAAAAAADNDDDAAADDDGGDGIYLLLEKHQSTVCHGCCCFTTVLMLAIFFHPTNAQILV